MLQRLTGVFALKPPTFEEIEHDQSATVQAGVVVVIVALLTGVGSALFSWNSGRTAIGSLIGGILWTLAGWLLASVIVYFIGTSLFGGKADLGEMLRVVGFSMAPLALGIIPCLGGLIGTIWAMAAAFIGVRQGLDIDNTKTLLTVAIAFGVYLVGYLVINAFSAITNIFM
jgi:hypothetical protein